MRKTLRHWSLATVLALVTAVTGPSAETARSASSPWSTTMWCWLSDLQQELEQVRAELDRRDIAPPPAAGAAPPGPGTAGGGAAPARRSGAARDHGGRGHPERGRTACRRAEQPGSTRIP
ncbi:MAG: hypothetical protein U5L11_01705 [Arhodomonas sp.]|nr:hypothetical protein [Arhodomonas sp.]